MNRVFFVNHVTENMVIKVVEGETGYYPTDLTQTQMEQENALRGVSPEEALAARDCSMFNCWGNFDKIVESYRKVA